MELRADCERCFGLCCVAAAFARSADFAIDKPAGTPCPNLQADFRCGIHAELRQRGFRGCAVFDCFGAGQHVSQVLFGGTSWQADARRAHQMFNVFVVVRQLHELLWYLTEALRLPAAQPYTDDLTNALNETTRLTHTAPEALLALDLPEYREKVNAVLVQASEAARKTVRSPRADYRGADLIGTNLRKADLRGANLRGACLIQADLRQVDLSLADLTGADLRDTNLGGADLAAALFVTQAQLDSAHGSGATRLPHGLSRPSHWLPEAPRSKSV